jgi:hypothetical protein
MYNIIFDDDDEEKKNVEVKVDDNPIVSEDVKEGFKEAKDSFKEAIEQAKEAFVKAKDEFIKKDEETDAEIAERTGEEVTQDIVVPPEKEELDDLFKSLDDESEDDDPLFKKL